MKPAEIYRVSITNFDEYPGRMPFEFFFTSKEAAVKWLKERKYVFIDPEEKVYMPFGRGRYNGYVIHGKLEGIDIYIKNNITSYCTAYLEKIPIEA